MQLEKAEAQGLAPKGLTRKTDNNQERTSTAARRKQQALHREFPEGWSRRIDPLSDTGGFLDDWGSSIVALHDDPEVDALELYREAMAWERAVHASSNWRAA
jgi:hypothetical protein